MQHSDHVALLRPGVPRAGGQWAEFGAGTGAFTLALAELLGPGATLYAVDQEAGALREAARRVKASLIVKAGLIGPHTPGLTLVPITADFTKALPTPLPPLDGLVMANALHFVPDRHKDAVVTRLKEYLKPRGVFILVEYNADRGNLWVPHPLTFAQWEALAGRAGLRETRLLGVRPSSFLREFFAAGSLRPRIGE